MSDDILKMAKEFCKKAEDKAIGPAAAKMIIDKAINYISSGSGNADNVIKLLEALNKQYADELSQISQEQA